MKKLLALAFCAMVGLAPIAAVAQEGYHHHHHHHHYDHHHHHYHH